MMGREITLHVEEDTATYRMQVHIADGHTGHGEEFSVGKNIDEKAMIVTIGEDRYIVSHLDPIVRGVIAYHESLKEKG